MATLTDAPKILKNAVLPFNPMQAYLAGGAVEYVAVEVLVSKFLRKMLRFEDRGFLELAYIHALSLPFLGGASSFVEAPGSYTDDYVKQFTDGAKGVPAVLIAQWIVATCSRGFHIPSISIKDVFITAAAKSLSKPLLKIVFKNLPEDMASALNVVGEMTRKQNATAFQYAKSAGGGR